MYPEKHTVILGLFFITFILQIWYIAMKTADKRILRNILLCYPFFTFILQIRGIAMKVDRNAVTLCILASLSFWSLLIIELVARAVPARLIIGYRVANAR